MEVTYIHSQRVLKNSLKVIRYYLKIVLSRYKKTLTFNFSNSIQYRIAIYICLEQKYFY